MGGSLIFVPFFVNCVQDWLLMIFCVNFLQVGNPASEFFHLFWELRCFLGWLRLFCLQDSINYIRCDDYKTNQNITYWPIFTQQLDTYCPTQQTEVLASSISKTPLIQLCIKPLCSSNLSFTTLETCSLLSTSTKFQKRKRHHHGKKELNSPISSLLLCFWRYFFITFSSFFSHSAHLWTTHWGLPCLLL